MGRSAFLRFCIFLQNKVIKLNKDVLLKAQNNSWKTSVKERGKKEKGRTQKGMSKVIEH